METVKLIAQPLTPQAFEPFGEVIEVGAARCHYAINNGATERYHALATAESVGEGSRVGISIFRSLLATRLPYRISSMERHPLGSQAFMPISAGAYWVVVAPPDATLAPREVQAFLCSGHQGVNYRRGVWHHSLLALQAGMDFLVVDRLGSEPNCDAASIAVDLVLTSA